MFNPCRQAVDPKKEKFKDDTEADALLGRSMLNEWTIKI